MSSSGKFSPITAISNPIATKFGKSSETSAKSTNDSVLAIKFSPMHQNGIDPEGRAAKNGLHSFTHRPQINGHLSAHMPAEHKKNSSLCRSSLVKLIGSFLVGVVCLSIVAVAVMIRTDSSRDQSSKAASSINRRSIPHTTLLPNTTSLASESLNKVSLQMLNSDTVNVGLVSSDSVNVPVPIKVVIDPNLIAPMPGASPPMEQSEGESTNVHLKQSLDSEESDTRPVRAAIKTDKSPVDSFNRYVIEMDIKVKKSN